jgi:hypothetical protein
MIVKCVIVQQDPSQEEACHVFGSISLPLRALHAPRLNRGFLAGTKFALVSSEKPSMVGGQVGFAPYFTVCLGIQEEWKLCPKIESNR